MTAQEIQELVVASASLFAGVILLVGKPGRLGDLGDYAGRVGLARIPSCLPRQGSDSS